MSMKPKKGRLFDRLFGRGEKPPESESEVDEREAITPAEAEQPPVSEEQPRAAEPAEPELPTEELEAEEAAFEQTAPEQAEVGPKQAL